MSNYLVLCRRKIFTLKSKDVVPVFLLNSFSSETKTKTHYETLNLSTNCSSREIKDAFISLSKQYHPDKNKDNPNAQDEFVKLNEAYNILIKPDSRKDYDSTLKNHGETSQGYRQSNKTHFYEVHKNEYHYQNPWKDPSFAKNRNFSNEPHRNYYGVKGLKKQSNDQIVFWLIILGTFGLFLQILIVRRRKTQEIEEFKQEEQPSESDAAVIMQQHEESVKSEGCAADTTKLNGRRIVNIVDFVQLKELERHSPLGCTFSNMEMISEKRLELKSGFIFHCKMCNFKATVWSERNSPSILDAIYQGDSCSIALGLCFPSGWLPYNHLVSGWTSRV